MDYEKLYKETLERANKKIKECGHNQGRINMIKDIFPELKESKDELMRKKAIAIIKQYNIICDREGDKCYTADGVISWLEEQGEKTIPKNIDDAALQYVDTCAVDGEVTHGNITEPYWNNHSMMNAYKAGWLEKQGKQEHLYIRFGEIPIDEKSKIFQGEIEVGTENGVSVYPAFKTSEGDIVLGLSLPITKTTLYTQQHLIEYDDRPCYLVKGDYVGKDIDGQPLINNISIIEKIDDYRVKEEKQDNPIKKVEPKFKVGDWVVYCGKPYQITGLHNDTFTLTSCDGSYFFNNVKSTKEPVFHLWTIQDAKDGDVLALNNEYFLFKEKKNSTTECYISHCFIDSAKTFRENGEFLPIERGNKVCPTTKEQYDLLFSKMKETGYEWDVDKKELRKIEQGCYHNDGLYYAIDILEKTFGKVEGYQSDDGKMEHQTAIETVNALYHKKPAEWSEEDERMLKSIIYCIDGTPLLDYDQIAWLKSLKPQPNWKPTEEQMEALKYFISFHEDHARSLTTKWEEFKNIESLYNDLKSL